MKLIELLEAIGADIENGKKVQMCYPSRSWEDYDTFNADSKLLKPFYDLKIMYKDSGGTNPYHRCDECLRYRSGKHPRCLNYNGDVDWKPNYIACKFFTDEKEDEIKGQIDIFDLLQNKVID